MASETIEYEIVLDEHVFVGDMLLDPKAMKAHIHPDTDLASLVPKLDKMGAQLIFEARKETK